MGGAGETGEVSWNKNTSRLSNLDDQVYFLEEAGGVRIKDDWTEEKIGYYEYPYRFDVIGRVRGRGVGDPEYLDIRRLEYKTSVWLERMERHPDCDMDDLITAHFFKKGQEPTRWDIEIELKE